MSEIASLNNLPHDSLYDISLDLYDALARGMPPDQHARNRFIPNMSAMSPSYLYSTLHAPFHAPRVWAGFQFDADLEKPRAYSLGVLTPTTVKIKSDRFSRTQAYVHGLAFDMWSSKEDVDDFKSLVQVASGVSSILFPGKPIIAIEGAQPDVYSEVVREVLPYEVFAGFMKRKDGHGKTAMWQKASLVSDNPFILD